MRNLFRPPSSELTRDMSLVLRAVAEALPLSAAHKRDLPHAVRDLSRLLTADRELSGQPYWTSPRLLSAYCRYFLPWNVQRMAWLLPGLGLDRGLALALDGGLGAEDRILDLGSGPLTLPIALWTVYPALRTRPLHFTCVDVAPHAMASGKEIFTRLAGGDSPWRFDLARAPLEAGLRAFKGKAKLILAGNVLNELPPPRRVSLSARLEDLARLVASRLAPDGRFFAVEPGTRLGGRLLSLLRRAALFSGAGLVPESPCPHMGPCPMLAKNAGSWCHFTVPAAGPGAAVPLELLGLTRRAKLEKRSLSLSCLVLRHGETGGGDESPGRNPADPLAWEERPDTGDFFADDDDDFEEEEYGAEDGPYAPRPESGASFVRIVSDPIRIPGREAHARYACSERGLALVHNAGRMPSGAALTVRWPEEDAFDPKTGAIEAELPEQGARKKSPAEPDTGKSPSGPVIHKQPAKPASRKQPAKPASRKQPAEPASRKQPAEPASRKRPAASGSRKRPPRTS